MNELEPKKSAARKDGSPPVTVSLLYSNTETLPKTERPTGGATTAPGRREPRTNAATFPKPAHKKHKDTRAELRTCGGVVTEPGIARGLSGVKTCTAGSHTVHPVAHAPTTRTNSAEEPRPLYTRCGKSMSTGPTPAVGSATHLHKATAGPSHTFNRQGYSTGPVASLPARIGDHTRAMSVVYAKNKIKIQLANVASAKGFYLTNSL